MVVNESTVINPTLEDYLFSIDNAFLNLIDFDIEFFGRLHDLSNFSYSLPANDSDNLENMRYNGAYFRYVNIAGLTDKQKLLFMPYVFDITTYDSTLNTEEHSYLFMCIILNITNANKTVTLWINDLDALLDLNKIDDPDYTVDGARIYVYGRNALFDEQIFLTIATETVTDSVINQAFKNDGEDAKFEIICQEFEKKVDDLLTKCFAISEKLDEDGVVVLDVDSQPILEPHYDKAIFAAFPSYNLGLITDIDYYTFFQAITTSESGAKVLDNMVSRSYSSAIIYSTDNNEFDADLFKIYFSTIDPILIDVYVRVHLVKSKTVEEVVHIGSIFTSPSQSYDFASTVDDLSTDDLRAYQDEQTWARNHNTNSDEELLDSFIGNFGNYSRNYIRINIHNVLSKATDKLLDDDYSGRIDAPFDGRDVSPDTTYLNVVAENEKVGSVETSNKYGESVTLNNVSQDDCSFIEFIFVPSDYFGEGCLLDFKFKIEYY